MHVASPAEPECTRRMGVSEGRLRKWLLSINGFLRNQNGVVAEALHFWKEVRSRSGTRWPCPAR